MDLAYYRYLAQNVAPRELARAVAVRARRALRGTFKLVLDKSGARPFFFEPSGQERRRRALYALATPRDGLIGPGQRDETARLLLSRWPEECERILAEAEAARLGRLDLFGRTVDCAKGNGSGVPIVPIDYARDPIARTVRWDARKPGLQLDLFVQGADAKAAWEVGRLQHLWRFAQARWLAPDAAERSRWARAWLATLRQFRADCPAPFGVQWSCAMEVSLRAVHAALTFAYVRDDPAFDARGAGELLDFLEEHGTFVEDHLEETGAVRTNHYAADLVGLVVIGALFPELPRSGVWLRELGRKLWEEIPRQCRPDGTHFESSIGYHRLCAELWLIAVLAARAAGVPAPHEVQGAVSNLFRSLAGTLNPSGEIPQVGDLDSCRGLPLLARSALEGAAPVAVGAAALGDPALRASGAPCPPEVAWLLGADGVRRFEALRPGLRTGSVLLPDGGLAVLRSGDAWLCLSAGPNGQGGTGGHAHNDKNAVELSFGDVPVVLDRGTFVYARDPAERNARRGTAGHSTVQVDSAEQNRIVPGRLFALPDTARARIVSIARRDGLELATGEHHGYARLGIVHRRTTGLLPGGRAAAIVDELHGSGSHRIDLRWIVPHTDLVGREATPAEAVRLEEIHGLGLSFGYDLRRCVLVRDGSGKEIALFAFGATLPWRLAISATDVSPGYAETRPASLISLSSHGDAPARLFTAVLSLR